MKNRRNYGIDALRIVSMFMVVVLHVLERGGILANVQDLAIKAEMFWLIEILCFGCVNCYALISGYVGIEANNKYSNIIYLWIQTLFFSVSGLLLSLLICPDSISLGEIIRSSLPVLSQRYWYFTAYFVLFFFIPILNHIIKTVDKKVLKRVFIVICIVFCVIGSLKKIDVFGINSGYTVLWLLILYCIGGYISYYDVFRKSQPRKLFYLYLLSSLCVCLIRILTGLITKKIFGEPLFMNIMLRYNNIFVLSGSIFLLGAFSKLNIKGIYIKFISIISPLTYGIYIIHLTPLIWNFLENRFVFLISYEIYLIIPAILFFSTIIFCACGIIDYFRSQLFNILNVRKISIFIGDTYIENILKNLI